MLATYHSDRGEKSALILVRDPFMFGVTPVYVPRVAVAGKEPGETFEISDEYKIVDMVDPETGEVRTASDGTPLKVLAR